MYAPNHLKRWTLPDSYWGASWPDYYVGLSRHRESDSLTRSNFECYLKAIGGENGDTVRVIRESHWAVGWIEWIAIHESNTEALTIADEIEGKLEGYPVVNEDHWSDLEWNEVHDYWESMTLRERVEWCRDAGESIFAARPGHSIPEVIYERLRD